MAAGVDSKPTTSASMVRRSWSAIAERDFRNSLFFMGEYIVNWVDRELQRKVLQSLFEVYPNQFSAICLHQKLFPDEVLNMKSEHRKESPDFSKQTPLQIALGIASDSYVQRVKTLQLESYQSLFKNVHYLSESGLVEIEITKADEMNKDFKCRINNKGIDSLQDDGGLSAAINHGTVTVKFHSDTIQQLLSTKIDKAEIPETEKSELKSAISIIKNAALTKITEVAIENAPVAVMLAAIKQTIGN